MKSTQAQPPDFRVRLGAGVEKEFGKKITVGIEYEHRFDNYLTTFDKAFIEPTFSFDPFDFLSFGAGYRLVYDQNITRERHYEQRFSGFARLKYDFDDFEIKYKTTIQYGADDLTNTVFSYGNKLVNRHALELEYNWFGLPLVPFAGYEFFIHINNPNGAIINQYRLKVGMDYKLTGASTFTLYYLFENEFNIAYPVDSHVAGVKYRFKF
ncbi:MAG: DUF2490 domain-containing protein [Prolixibacteraceae bacterium]|nr:DUF2490 domain-containing protein [Prolixibacteraceae bacterium]